MKRSSLVAVILSFFCLVATWPSAAENNNPEETPAILKLDRPQEGEWFGLYIRGKKAGFLFNNLKEGYFHGKKAVVSVGVMEFNASASGANVQRKLVMSDSMNFAMAAVCSDFGFSWKVTAVKRHWREIVRHRK